MISDCYRFNNVLLNAVFLFFDDVLGGAVGITDRWCPPAAIAGQGRYAAPPSAAAVIAAVPAGLAPGLLPDQALRAPAPGAHL